MTAPKPAAEPKPLTEQELRQWLLGLLSRREYSAQELKQKLKQKGACVEQISQLLEWAQQRDYQNELRYARMQVNAKLHKRYGWFYISQFCAQQGIKKELQQQLLEELDIDWFEVATEAYRKKYADKPIADYQDKLKRMRYLQSRGFGSDTIQLVFAELKEE